MSLHGYPTRVDEYESDDDIYHPSPYHSPRFQRRLSLQKPPMRFNPGYYEPDDQVQDDLSLPMRGMGLEDYPPRWTPPFYDEPHPGYLQRPFLVPEDDYPYYPDPVRPPPHHWVPPPADFRFQGDRLSDNEMMREPPHPPFLHRSFSSRSHRPDRPNQRMPPRRFQELDDESDDEPPLSRRSSTGFRKPPPAQRRRRRANSLSAMPTRSHSRDRMRPPGTPFHYSEDEPSGSEEDEIPTVPGPRLNASHPYGNFAPPPMQPNVPPVILPQHMPPVENGPPPPMGPPHNPMFVAQPGDYFEPRMNNAQEGTGPSTPSANEPNNPPPPPPPNNNPNMPPPHMGQWMGPPHPGPPVFPGSPGGNNPMFNQQNMMGMGMPNPMVNMFNNPMMTQLWGFPNYPMPFMGGGGGGASEPTLVNPESTSPHRANDKEKPRSEPIHENLHQNHPDMQVPPPQTMMKPESSNSSSRRRFSIFNIFGKKNEYHYEPPMQPPFPEDQFRGPPLHLPLPGPFSIPIQDKSSKERKKIDQYEKLGMVWAWRVTQEPENLENIRIFCPKIDVTRHYSFNINNQKLIKRKGDRPEIMLGSEKHLNGNLMIRPGVRTGFFIPKNSPNRNDPVVIRLDLIVQQFNRAEMGNGFVFNHQPHLR